MQILLPVIILGALGAIFGLWLTFAQKIFAVKTDPKIDHIFSLLPGSNCGACGKAGCYGLAEALAKGDVDTITCPVVQSEDKQAIAKLMGVEVQEAEKQVATLLCGGGARCKENFRYKGPHDCRIANLIFGAHKACGFGCTGLGTCVGVCPFDAIKMDGDNLPKIDPHKCTACGKCIKACPKNVLILTPVSSQYRIDCNSNDRGPDVMKACKVGCIGCGKCVKVCPVTAIELKDNLARIDHQKCENCGKCIEVCPTKAIARRTDGIS